jgi:hypothetical protein
MAEDPGANFTAQTQGSSTIVHDERFPFNITVKLNAPLDVGNKIRM